MPMYTLPKAVYADFATPGKQPTGPVQLDYSNPIARKIAFAWLGRNPYIELANNSRLSKGGNPNFGPYYATFDGTNDHFDQSYTNTGLFNEEHSVLVKAKAANTSSTQFMFSQAASGETEATNVQLQIGITNTPRIRLGWEYSGGANDIMLSDTISGVAGNWRTYGATITQNASDADVTFFYEHRKLNTDNSTLKPSGGTSTDNYVGASYSGTEEFNGDIEFVYVTRGALTDAEMINLSLDPYQIFKPASPIVLFTTEAAGGSYTLVADPGSYSLSGTDATLAWGNTLTAGPGSYSLSGTDAALIYDRLIIAGSSSYGITGVDVEFNYGYTLSTDTGSYALTGATVDFGRTYVTSLVSGAYALTGAEIALSYFQEGLAGQMVAMVPTLGDRAMQPTATDRNILARR